MTRVVTVTLNPAVDITYEVPTFTLGSSVRVTAVRTRAGGKGVNVAAVVRALGGESTVIALAARTEPDPFRDGLDRLGLHHRLIPAFEAVRHTVAVVQTDGSTTILLEPGDVVPPGASDALIAALSDEIGGADTVVVSGSIPPGMPPDLPARLASLATERAVPVILDVSGAALRATTTTAAVLTPNRDEFAELVGKMPATDTDIVRDARRLLDQGVAAVVVTLGERGAVAVTPAGAWVARPPAMVDGNPTGAGDAAVAAIALHLPSAEHKRGEAAPWAAALADAVATSAACVLRPVAGEIDLEARARWLDKTTVEELS
jgi:1-phosphofructokinase/tagatose 6-phosphate kinase